MSSPYRSFSTPPRRSSSLFSLASSSSSPAPPPSSPSSALFFAPKPFSRQSQEDLASIGGQRRSFSPSSTFSFLKQKQQEQQQQQPKEKNEIEEEKVLPPLPPLPKEPKSEVSEWKRRTPSDIYKSMVSDTDRQQPELRKYSSKTTKTDPEPHGLAKMEKKEQKQQQQQQKRTELLAATNIKHISGKGEKEKRSDVETSSISIQMVNNAPGRKNKKKSAPDGYRISGVEPGTFSSKIVSSSSHSNNFSSGTDTRNISSSYSKTSISSGNNTEKDAGRVNSYTSKSTADSSSTYNTMRSTTVNTSNSSYSSSNIKSKTLPSSFRQNLSSVEVEVEANFKATVFQPSSATTNYSSSLERKSEHSSDLPTSYVPMTSLLGKPPVAYVASYEKSQTLPKARRPPPKSILRKPSASTHDTNYKEDEKDVFDGGSAAPFTAPADLKIPRLIGPSSSPRSNRGVALRLFERIEADAERALPIRKTKSMSDVSAAVEDGRGIFAAYFDRVEKERREAERKEASSSKDGNGITSEEFVRKILLGEEKKGAPVRRRENVRRRASASGAALLIRREAEVAEKQDEADNNKKSAIATSLSVFSKPNPKDKSSPPPPSALANGNFEKERGKGEEGVAKSPSPSFFRESTPLFGRPGLDLDLDVSVGRGRIRQLGGEAQTDEGDTPKSPTGSCGFTFCCLSCRCVQLSIMTPYIVVQLTIQSPVLRLKKYAIRQLLNFRSYYVDCHIITGQ